MFGIFKRRPKILINSRDTLEEAAVYYGLLPFFINEVRGLSVQEMCAPGLLFGGNFDEGCWEWKGPVIRHRTTAYGKFFNRKAGFVSLELLPEFLNYRRNRYPVKPDSTEEMLLDIIKENDGMTSTELKEVIFGNKSKKRTAIDLPDLAMITQVSGKRKSLEGPLQRLQMGGWLVISDFTYKHTKRGERYGWGVAQYSTPELIFNRRFDGIQNSPEESFNFIVKALADKCPGVSKNVIRSLLK